MTPNESDTTSGPLVSVIMPTYNYGRMIGEALESLQSQTYVNWECIVIDDGSTDDTAEVVARVAERDPRIRYTWQTNQRQSVAKNTALSQTRGKYLQFLDADDLIESHKLESQVAYLEAHPTVDIFYGAARYFRTHSTNEQLYSMGEDNLPWMPAVSGTGIDILASLVRQNIMVINSPLVRCGLVETVGLFDVELTPAEDWDYWLRCALAGANFRFVENENALALVRIHPTSSSQNRVRMNRAIVLIRKKLEASLNDEKLLALNHELRVADEVALGIEEAARGSSLRGAWHLARAAQVERRWRWRIKLVGCALAAPIVSEVRLKAMIASPITEFVKSLGRRGASG